MRLPSQIEGKLRQVCNGMLQYLNAAKVVSRLELFVKAREALDEIGLSSDESKSIASVYSLRADQLIVISIIGETPYMMGCPFLHEEIRFKGLLFYHSHTFSPSGSDLESAVQRLRTIRLAETERMIGSMFAKAKYSKISEDQKTGIKRYKKHGGSETVRSIILESVKDVIPLLDELPEGVVLGVPTEDTPAPFVSIYRSNRGKIKEKRISIIVANLEDQRISPFLGYPSDKDLISQFDEPDLAVRISTIWGEEEDGEMLHES